MIPYGLKHSKYLIPKTTYINLPPFLKSVIIRWTRPKPFLHIFFTIFNLKSRELLFHWSSNPKNAVDKKPRISFLEKRGSFSQSLVLEVYLLESSNFHVLILILILIPICFFRAARLFRLES
jgi:hypothetical protein